MTKWLETYSIFDFEIGSNKIQKTPEYCQANRDRLYLDGSPYNTMNPVKHHTFASSKIADYLYSHPDFFLEHPELLPGLNIPCTSDRNVASLLEYQVARLCRQNSELQSKILQTEHGSDYHRQLSECMHKLSLKLLGANTAEDLYDILSAGLKTNYGADRVKLLIFTRHKIRKNRSGMGFFDTNNALRFMFAELFHRGKPLCGSLQEEHLRALFGQDSESIKSTVLLPWEDGDWRALLALGSYEANRYSYGQGLDLLCFLNDFINKKLRKLCISPVVVMPLQTCPVQRHGDGIQ
jgi:Uncharacterized protein conserved in bacteria